MDPAFSVRTVLIIIGKICSLRNLVFCVEQISLTKIFFFFFKALYFQRTNNQPIWETDTSKTGKDNVC